MNVIVHYSYTKKSNMKVLTHSSKSSKREYSTIVDVLKWLESEINYWDWLYELIDKQEIPKDSFKPYIDLYDFFIQLKKDAELIDLENSDYFQPLFELYNNGLIDSKSNKANYIISFKGDRPLIAAYLVSYFTDETGFEDQENIEAILYGVLFKKKLNESSIEEYENRITQLYKTYTDEINTLKKEYNDSEKNYNFLNKKLNEKEEAIRDLIVTSKLKIDEIIKKSNEEIRSNVNTRKIEFQKLIEESNKQLLDEKKQIEKIKNSFIQEKALEAPVEYWKTNQGYHKKEGKKYLKYLVIYLPIAIISILFIGWFLLYERTENNLGNSVLFIAVIGIIIWGLKILSKLYLSHRHLETESSERVVMANTFLALLNENVNITDQDRTIVMMNLFRPSITGILQNEQLNTSLIDTAANFIKVKKD